MHFSAENFARECFLIYVRIFVVIWWKINCYCVKIYVYLQGIKHVILYVFIPNDIFVFIYNMIYRGQFQRSARSERDIRESEFCLWILYRGQMFGYNLGIFLFLLFFYSVFTWNQSNNTALFHRRVLRRLLLFFIISILWWWEMRGYLESNPFGGVELLSRETTPRYHISR